MGEDKKSRSSLDDLHGHLDVAPLGELLHRVELRHERVPEARRTQRSTATQTPTTTSHTEARAKKRQRTKRNRIGRPRRTHRRWRRGSWEAELKEAVRLSWWSRPNVFWIELVTCARFCLDASSGRSPPATDASTPFPAAAEGFGGGSFHDVVGGRGGAERRRLTVESSGREGRAELLTTIFFLFSF